MQARQASGPTWLVGTAGPTWLTGPFSPARLVGPTVKMYVTAIAMLIGPSIGPSESLNLVQISL